MAKSKFQPNAPSKGLFLAAAILGILGILSEVTHIQELSNYSFLLVAIGFGLLLFGTVAKNI